MSSPSVARQLARYFLNGLLVVAPAGLTLYVCWLVFRTVDGWLALPIPGVGFIVTIALITLLGYLARNFVTQTLLGWVDDLLNRVPFVRLLYSALRDLTEALVGGKKRFGRPVLVRLGAGPAAGLRVLGFVTREDATELGAPGHLAVYLPQSYNFAGQTVIVPKDRVENVALAGSEVMTFIVSGGVTEIEVGGSAGVGGG
ncbi:MAG: DUF502 domain-containing protein [Gemmatimonadales bacterium]